MDGAGTRCTRCWPTGRRSRSARRGRVISTRSRPCTRRCPRTTPTCGSSTSAGRWPRSRPGGSARSRPRPGGAARAGRRRGGRRGQLRHGRDRDSRGLLRGGRPHASQGHRHPAARASGLPRQEPPDHHLHRGDPDGEQGHAERVRRSRTARRTPLRGRGLRADVPAAQRGRRPHARQLPERRGRKGAPRGGRQPAVRVRARVGRGDRREPAAGHGGPGDPGQHPGQRVRRPALRGEPAGPADRRRAVPGLGARPARAGRPGGDRGTRRDGA